MPKNILVTGGKGFIGAHLCNRLADNGHNVIAIDIEKYISRTKLSGKVKFYFDDVCDMFNSWNLLPDRIHEIYHLASIASPPIYKRNPIETIKTNVNGTIKICALAKDRGAKILLASTSEVYGNPEVHPQKENYFGNVNTLSDRACYDESKRMAETIVNTYVKKHKMQATIVRIFNTYGSGMALNDGRFIVEFTKRILKNQDVIIYNSGNQTRSPCYIDDTITMLIKAMKKGNFGPYNIGNDNEYSVRHILDMIAAILNKSPQIVHCPLNDGDPKKRKPDLTKSIQAGIITYPRMPLLQGLRITIEDIKAAIQGV